MSLANTVVAPFAEQAAAQVFSMPATESDVSGAAREQAARDELHHEEQLSTQAPWTWGLAGAGVAVVIWLAWRQKREQ